MKRFFQLIMFVGFFTQPLWAMQTSLFQHVSPPLYAIPAPAWLDGQWPDGECDIEDGCVQRAQEMFDRIRTSSASVPQDFSYLIIIAPVMICLSYSVSRDNQWVFHALLSYTHEGVRYIVDPIFEGRVLPYREWLVDITQDRAIFFPVTITSDFLGMRRSSGRYNRVVIDNHRNILPFVNSLDLLVVDQSLSNSRSSVGGDELLESPQVVSNHNALLLQSGTPSSSSQSIEEDQISVASRFCQYLVCLFSVSLFHRGIALPKH